MATADFRKFTNEDNDRIVSYRDRLGRKVDASDIERQRPENYAAMEEIVRAYLGSYVGNFSYLQEMQYRVAMGNDLTTRQFAGVLNCIYAEWQRCVKVATAAKAEQDGEAAPAVAQAVQNGTYTVVLGSDEDYVTLRVKDDWREDAPEGAQVAQYLYGPDNGTDYSGFAFVNGTSAKVWRKYADDSRLVQALQVLLQADTAARGEAALAYAMKSGRCSRCNRKLTVPASLHAGYGPECIKHVA